MTTRAGSRPSSSRIRSWSRPTGDSTPWVVTASPVRRAARAAARWTRSSSAETHGLSVPISPMIPGRTPVPSTPSRDLGHELVGEVVDRPPVDARLRGVVHAAIPAAAHHDVEAARRRDVAQPRRVAPDARERQVDQAAPAGVAEPRQLLEDHRLVAGQLPVVPAAGDVPQRDLGVLVRERPPEGRGIDRAEDRLDVCHRRAMLRGRGGLGTDRCAAGRAAASLARSAASTALARAQRIGRSVALAGLDPLEEQAVEERQEAAREASTSSQAGSSPRAMPSRSSSWAAPTRRSRGGPASRGPRARRRPRPTPGRG